MKIGCSPAYCFAHFAEQLTYENLVWAIRRVGELGFSGLQLETYASNQVAFYTDDHIHDIRKLYGDLGLESSQFIIHSAKAGISSIDRAVWQSALDEIKHLVEVCVKLEIIHTINVPSAPPLECVLSYYETYPGATQPVLGLPDGRSWQDFWQIYVEHIDQIAQLVESAGMRLAIEAVPHGIISNSDSMLRLIESLPERHLGLILDTGHMYYLHESFTLLCNKLAGRIYGTHLNDNDGFSDDHNPPGQGNIDWHSLLSALQCCGYEGALDIEINLSSNPDNTYVEAKEFFEKQLNSVG